jgi:uncharacterized protein YndB with AHSA1/START domain
MSAESSLREFTISRTFDAPRDLVWKALTEPDQMAKWFTPKGMTGQIGRHELEPGGMHHSAMVAPDGKEMWGRMVYQEIVAPERLVYINAFSDAAGGLTRHPMSATWPLEMLTTIKLAENGGKTTLTLTWTPYHASVAEIATFEGAHAGMKQGWTGTFDQLAEFLAQK